MGRKQDLRRLSTRCAHSRSTNSTWNPNVFPSLDDANVQYSGAVFEIVAPETPNRLSMALASRAVRQQGWRL